jgi:hypothetical protein
MCYIDGQKSKYSKFLNAKYNIFVSFAGKNYNVTSEYTCVVSKWWNRNGEFYNEIYTVFSLPVNMMYRCVTKPVTFSMELNLEAELLKSIDSTYL